MTQITVLIPTYNRPEALSVTLTSLIYQIEKDFEIVIADQSEEPLLRSQSTLKSVISVLEEEHHKVKYLRNIPPRGMAHQRHFLLQQSFSPYTLFIDDDLILEPYVIDNMKKILTEEKCGFVGCAVIGLSYKNIIRPEQQAIEFWDGVIQPEAVSPKSIQWERYKLHNAANIYHVQEKLKASPSNPLKYKVAWVGGCVMFDTQKLNDVGGYSFWKELPEKHCGEDVLAQLRVMKKYGGCGIIPSGVYHQELETTVSDRKINAPEVLAI